MRAFAKSFLPQSLHPFVHTLWRRYHNWPFVGFVQFGSFRRLQPINRNFGYDRGLPLDRYYIEEFLLRQKTDIHGHVLEIADSFYTRKFGGEQVTQVDVLHATPDNPQATIIGDLSTGSGIPSNAFDCIILTQTLNVIYDIKSSIGTCYTALKPGGVLLASLPGISQISRYDMDRWGDYWRLTSLAIRRLLAGYFGDSSVEVQTKGNVHVACAFLYGLAAEDVRRKALEYTDPDYELLLLARAVKR
jgi:SAM-dependent methyltransferase